MNKSTCRPTPKKPETWHYLILMCALSFPLWGPAALSQINSIKSTTFSASIAPAKNQTSVPKQSLMHDITADSSPSPGAGSNIALGYRASIAITSGSQNVALGNQALSATTGSHNTAAGYAAKIAGRSIRTRHNNDNEQ